MATEIFDSGVVYLIDGTEIEVKPLKIKYLREFMEYFDKVKDSKDDAEAISLLAQCARVAMKQYYPSIKTIEQLEDSIDLKSIYKILDFAAGVKVDPDKVQEESVKEQTEESQSTWEKLDLASLESELFLMGKWRDYEDLETSLSMPELIATLEAKRSADYENRKFFAAIQGIDMEKDSEDNSNAWEKMKAKVFSGGSSSDPNDILSLQGYNAAKAGFGIGMGLSYERID